MKNKKYKISQYTGSHLVAIIQKLVEIYETNDKDKQNKAFNQMINIISENNKTEESLYLLLNDDEGEPIKNITLNFRWNQDHYIITKVK